MSVVTVDGVETSGDVGQSAFPEERLAGGFVDGLYDVPEVARGVAVERGVLGLLPRPLSRYRNKATDGLLSYCRDLRVARPRRPCTWRTP